MRFTLEITMKNTEGVLERILGRLRQRNLNIQAINAKCTTDLSNIEATIIVESKMGAEPTMKQLAKLYDVQKINMFALDIEGGADQVRCESSKIETVITKLGEQNEVYLSV